MKIVLDEKDFSICRDSFQWIIGYGKSESQGKISFSNKTYHPTLSGLLDELAEVHFKKETKKILAIEDLQQSITRVYELIDKVSQDLSDVNFNGSKRNPI